MKRIFVSSTYMKKLIPKVFPYLAQVTEKGSNVITPSWALPEETIDLLENPVMWQGLTNADTEPIFGKVADLDPDEADEWKLALIIGQFISPTRTMVTTIQWTVTPFIGSIEKAGYWYRFLRPYGISLRKALSYFQSYNVHFLLLDRIIDIQIAIEKFQQDQYDKYTRDPKNGKMHGSIVTQPDDYYSPEFNNGYEWKWGKTNFSVDNYSSGKYPINAMPMRTTSEQLYFKEPHLGKCKTLTNMYPGKPDIYDISDLVGINKGLKIEVESIMNGVYWTRHQYVTSAPGVYPPFYNIDWYNNSFCYSYHKETWHLYFTIDNQGTITPHNEKTGTTTDWERNVGTQWNETYSVADIPERYRIQEYVDELGG